MSRVGKKAISVPKGVEVKQDGDGILVKGPKGTLRTSLVAGIGIKVDGNIVNITRADEGRQTRAFHGLVRALVANNVKGVSEGFKRELDIIGVGYRAEVKPKEVVFLLGYSHPVKFPIPEGIEIAIDKAGHVIVTGMDKQKVGQVAAEIRGLRQPDPYKGKGIKYTEEVIRRKAGKAAGK
ncbi:MAG TPA: 50S ribosomal protein L6 [Thermoanaerobaculia bacterium]|nr:50S ribosomal protein L6 [Thermoanaerobaculia bacterium]